MSYDDTDNDHDDDDAEASDNEIYEDEQDEQGNHT